jgi:hypothetical protein
LLSNCRLSSLADNPFFEKLIKAMAKYHVRSGNFELCIIVPLRSVVLKEQDLHFPEMDSTTLFSWENFNKF